MNKIFTSVKIHKYYAMFIYMSLLVTFCLLRFFCDYYILYFQSSDQDKTFKPNAYKFGQKVELSKPI